MTLYHLFVALVFLGALYGAVYVIADTIREAE